MPTLRSAAGGTRQVPPHQGVAAGQDQHRRRESGELLVRFQRSVSAAGPQRNLPPSDASRLADALASPSGGGLTHDLGKAAVELG